VRGGDPIGSKKKKDFVFSIAAYRPPECSNQMGVARGLMLVKRGGKG
jgi:hypothetical protein